MFDPIRRLLDRLLGKGGTMPARADALPQDAAGEPWLTTQDRDAAVALAAAGYAAAPGLPADTGTDAAAGGDRGKPDTAKAGARRYPPARGEYDRQAPEPQANRPQRSLRPPPGNPTG